MRIGMVLDLPFPPDMRVENEALSLVAAGHEVFLLSFSFDLKQAESENYKGIRVERVFIVQKWKKRGRALINTILDWYSGFMSRKIRQFVRKNSIEILHAHDLYMLKAVFRANRFTRLPVVADLHENYVEALKSYTFANRFPGNILISIKRWAKSEIRWTQQTDQIITVIEEAVPRYISLGLSGQKITVVPNYVNLDEFTDPEDLSSIPDHLKKGFPVLYIGSFDIHRGLESMVGAVPKIIRHIPDFKLILVGDGPNKSSLQKMAAELGVTDYIFFEGFQPPSVLPVYIKSAKIGLIPHLKNVHTDHTIPHKLFHYMLFELPVLASDCNPLQRIVEATGAGLIFRHAEADHISERIIELYKDPEMRVQMGKSGREAVLAKYNWQLAGEKLIQLYQKLSPESGKTGFAKNALSSMEQAG